MLPTEAELRLLAVLWDRGDSTVREIHDEAGAGSAYTTTLKLLQIMHEKGLVARDESGRAHVYRPCVKREPTQRRMIADLVRRAFRGSTSELVLRALSDEATSPEELDRISVLLDRLERERADEEGSA